ncbi:sulfite exporter TauE/SafE family protein [Corynebacterium pygosceleis]|uniref:sulfite exporter TauE/SafE family protein n=1 Tax=Corynebacterium pygosceleis TaxID=2800406 RepID=UPI001907DA45|nr:sulfite exporter TauE/SafE family protein [Corynebacterium pygosceleis]MCK7674732.1 sulfite exporter TauE/SafE family protein [Corynebacterium pygosceleis]MCL0119679.1 sulfite exporter TauE/SafE family protein [Corynebacterium pygosceleis]
MSDLIAAVGIGVLVGAVIGALGAGGGIISVPVLTYLLGQTEHAATNGSLVIVAVTALLTLPGKARTGHVRWRDGVVFASMSCLGAVGGRLVNERIDGRLLFLLFSVLLLGVAAMMARDAIRQRRKENAGGGGGAGVVPEPSGPRAPVLIAGAAVLTGLLTGLFGVGGGFAVVPVLILFMRFTVREAAATSLLVMVIAAGVSILTGAVRGTFEVDWPVVLLFTAGSTLGGMLGGPLSERARPSTLTLLFSLLLFCMGAATLGHTLVAS